MSGPRLIDLTGLMVGRLTVQYRSSFNSPDKGRPRPMWFCTCLCGGSKIIRGDSLRKGDTRSCGCLGAEQFAGLIAARQAAAPAPDEQSRRRKAWLKNYNAIYFRRDDVLRRQRMLAQQRWDAKTEAQRDMERHKHMVWAHANKAKPGVTERQRAVDKAYRSDPVISERKKVRAKVFYEHARDTLSDAYVAECVIQDGPLKRSDIPSEILEVKRLQIQILRHLKNEKHNRIA